MLRDRQPIARFGVNVDPGESLLTPTPLTELAAAVRASLGDVSRDVPGARIAFGRQYGTPRLAQLGADIDGR